MKTVLVTGASGFIAKHIVAQLLNAGFGVVGSLRTPGRSAEVIAAVTPELDDASNLAKRLRFVTLDLDSDKGWQDAMAGIDVLVHTASIFPIKPPKDPQSLIDTNVNGTLRALRAAHAAGVNRVILTSSMAATGAGDLSANGTLDEDVWTNTDHPKLSVYSKSKTLAERAAWDFVRDTAPEMKLTTINPGLVAGPPLDAHYGTSCAVVERMIQGKDPMQPDLGFTIVDVRDVATMHVRAILMPASVGKRVIAASEFMMMRDLALVIKNRFPDLRTATRVAPNFMMRLMAIVDPVVRGIVPLLGRRETPSNARAIELLDMKFITGADAIVATAESIMKFRRT